MICSYNSEFQLQIDLINKLNKQGFNFELGSGGLSLVDKLHNVAAEVKQGVHAPEKLLYAISTPLQENEGIEFIALMNSKFVLFFNRPLNNELSAFRRMIIENNKGYAPEISSIPICYRRNAYHILGKPVLVSSLDEINKIKSKDLSSKSKLRRISVSLNNLIIVKSLLDKYEINVSKFLFFIFNSCSKHHSFLQINRDGWVYDSTGTLPFSNKGNGKTIQKTLYGYRGDYIPINDPFDAQIISSLSINHTEMDLLLHNLDRLEKMGVRREHGIFFTTDFSESSSLDITDANVKDNLIGQLMLEVCEKINPNVVVEPYAGAGTLIKDIIKSKKYQGALNDISTEYIQLLGKKYKQFTPKWKFTNFNLPEQDIKEILTEWNILDGQEILILTNPPYGTSSTNRLASTTQELEGQESRRLNINYPHGLGDKYGRGDLFLPTIGKLIDICQARGQGTLAFFSPHGLFCGRKKYNKLFRSLLENFVFQGGYLFSGKHFNSVKSVKPIAFTIWEYGGSTNIDSIYFNYENQKFKLKKKKLLKDYWRYDSGDKGCPDVYKKKPFLAVSHCEAFNTPKGKFFSLSYKQRDGKICRHTIKQKIVATPYSQELLLSVWSTVVGIRSMSSHPLYLDNAYVHLPDFNDESVLKILALTILNTLIFQMKSPLKYSQGNIGFDAHQNLVFGDKTGCSDYVEEIIQIITRFSGLLINRGNSTSIIELFEWLRCSVSVNGVEKVKKMRIYSRLLKEEVQKRLWEIGYFGNFIPFPEDF